MTSPGFLDFFVLEASEYIEQLDALLVRGANGVDAEALAHSARALRGSATMAKLAPFAELATALERVGRGLREGTVSWSPALTAALTATVDDLKILLRSARSWTPTDDQRAAARSAELARYAPAATASAAARPATPGGATGATFFAGESANIAAGFELLATRPDDRDAAANVLRRLRALRGVAGIRDVPLLADVMDGAELVARPLELGEGRLSPDRIALLRSAAVLLRRLAMALREGGGSEPQTPTAERDAFFAELARFQDRESTSARIVPITQLFYGDGGPHVVTAAPHPPTTPAERFRLEVVSQAEHLRGIVAEARRATADGAARERVRRELRQALGDIQRDAESFGETEVGKIVASHLATAQTLDAPALDALDALARALASPGAPGERLATRLATLGGSEGRMAGARPSGGGTGTATGAATKGEEVPRRPSMPVSSTAPTPIVTPAIRANARPPGMPNAAPGGTASPFAVPASHPATPAPASRDSLTPARDNPMPTAMNPASTPDPVPPRTPASGARTGGFTPGGSPRVSTPRDTMAVLDQGIDSLSSLAATPMSEPVVIPEQPLVPIDTLLYRGRAAIERAIELREEIRRGGAANADTMDELFDLLDLALAE